MSVTEQDLSQGRINDQLGDQLESISAQVEAGMERGRNAWAEWRESARGKTREWKDSLDSIAHERPWQLVGGAIGLGLVIGVLFARRR